MFHGLCPNSPRRVVYHPKQTEVVLGIVNDAEVREHVLHLSPLEKAEAAHHPIGYAVAFQRHLDLVGQGIHPVENRTILPLLPLPIGSKQLRGNVHALLPFISGGIELYFFPLPMVGPQVLPFPPPVVPDHRVGRFQNVSRGAVVLFQTDHPGILILLLEGENVLNGRPPEPVD